MSPTLVSTLALALSLAGSAARADDEAACGGEAFRFTLQDVEGRVFDGVKSVTKAPVVLVFYQGYKSGSVLDNLRVALERDPIIGKNTRLGEMWAGFPIIDYKEGWFVPGWAIDKALRAKIAKYPKTIFLQDKGECMTKSGTSNKCPGKTRIPYFQSNQGSLAVVYRGYLFKKFAGPTDSGPFIELIRQLSAQAEKGASYCETKKAIEG